MDTLKKNYKDAQEIELAWQELIEALKPLSPKEKEKETASLTKHHPARVTATEFSNWELIG